MNYKNMIDLEYFENYPLNNVSIVNLHIDIQNRFIANAQNKIEELSTSGSTILLKQVAPSYLEFSRLHNRWSQYSGSKYNTS